MLNTSIRLGSNSQTVQFNSPSHGILQRSHPKSIFVRFQKGSPMEDLVFSTNKTPCIDVESAYPYKRKEVVVLQVLVFGDNYFLCEVVEREFLIDELTNKS